MSIALKHIPCPAGSRCTAFQCIFGHANEKVPDATPPVAAARDSGQKSARDDDSPAHQGPRKRLKVGPDAASQPSPDPLRQDDLQGSDKLSGAKLERPQTMTKVASPPPLSRSRPSPSHASGAAKRAPTLSSAPRASIAAGGSKESKPPQKRPLQKKESLNPRLLKSSPASHETRLKLLRLVHQEFMRLNSELANNVKGDEMGLVLSDQDLITRALDEEQRAALEKAAVYPNVMKNKVMQYKRMSVTQWKAERVSETETTQQNGDAASDGPPRKIETGLPPAREVELLQRIVTPIHGLSMHGYVPFVPEQEVIQKALKGMQTAKGWEQCDRCRQRFQVFPGRREEDGALTSGGACNFHWGKTYIPNRVSGDRSRVPKRFRCCNQEIGESVGCITHDHHVYKVGDVGRLAAVLNFAETPANPLAPTDRGVSFDCEMGYTVYGMELIRLTATAWPTGEELLDVLVQPLGEILDLNSRYSGVWPEDLAQAEPWTAATTGAPSNSGEEAGGEEEGEARQGKKKLRKVSSPEAARDLLFSLISPTTPLVGHGLENDLNAVRAVHQNVVDTVLLFPHKGGLPYRQGLKALMYEHLNRRIQQETGPKMLGHDSGEDARAAGDLARLKVMDLWQDMRRAGWKLVDGEFEGPGAGAGAGAGAGSREGCLTEDFEQC